MTEEQNKKSRDFLLSDDNIIRQFGKILDIEDSISSLKIVAREHEQNFEDITGILEKISKILEKLYEKISSNNL